MEKGGWKGYPQIYRASTGLQVSGFSSPPLHAPCSFLIPAFFLPDKRPTTSSSFTGFQAPQLARRDSSLKRLTHRGSHGSKTPSPSSSEQQKSLNCGEEAPISASAPQEDKVDPAPEN